MTDLVKLALSKRLTWGRKVDGSSIDSRSNSCREPRSKEAAHASGSSANSVVIDTTKSSAKEDVSEGKSLPVQLLIYIDESHEMTKAERTIKDDRCISRSTMLEPEPIA
ncbi:hypothetical protein M378DRAFT_179779 [Amanita muscaria Koide BX008]|uniref:Uncharacterized protein n=1 Tax=Amanita muscaria (strain Koide BX008) TaxID=946122 RepID=A0A0C2SGN2_AMAMK|nr:hypothetical protein M378DRAFT_179779 [Amanita muscaria Koide BX008]